VSPVTARAPGHPEITRIVAPNPGPMTLEGTNTYVVDAGETYVIDPGPADAQHLEAVRAAAGDIAGVLITHSHADHSAGAEMLGAPVLWGTVGSSDELSDPLGGAPGATAASDRIGPFELIPTPGHARDHVAFGFGPVGFCGDLVLGEGSSIVPLGGGGLDAYLVSLERLSEPGFELLCPGHGPWVSDPQAKIAEYRAHRLDRENRLLDALERGERSRRRLLDEAWSEVPEALRPAAALAMDAHLEKLEAEGRLPPLEP
jgi:glyoxylase-like metal-dependent hydrolase (beta-lactamase superfamily II)